jgi:hypothetical protein
VTPKRDVSVGGGGRLLAVFGELAPRLTDYFMESSMIEAQQKGPVERDRKGTFEQPVFDLKERGCVDSHVMKSSLYTATKLHPLIASAIIGATVVGIAAALYHEINRKV